MASRVFHAKNDKELIVAWKLDINKILHVFNVCLVAVTWASLTLPLQTELALNTHTLVSDIHRNVVTSQQGSDGQHRQVSAIFYPSATECSPHPRLESGQLCATLIPWDPVSLLDSAPPGELPPPPPRACFGRDELVDKIIGLAGNLTPIALIGAGGIGKTSIALTVLHHNRIKEQFGDDRRFVRCDQFPASCAHLLSRISKVIGAGIENPEDLTPLRPFLSSRKIILILDNAESVLDPRGTNAQEIYDVVVELSEFSNICLCLTSRISTIPPTCKTLNIPVLSTEAARDTFYRICENNERPDLVDDILEQLDFHPLSVALLATVAHHNKWDNNQLTREWEERRTGVLRTEHNRSLAATIELSLTSPMFRELGPDARELLGVVAFFPQGINEDNINWLFPTQTHGDNSTSSPPTTTDRRNVFNRLCILSLTHRSGGFITMLAPLRDYLRLKVPASSPLLSATKEHYFRRLRVDLNPGEPGFEEAQWIRSEDVNVEHLLDVFTSVDRDSDDVWDACRDFIRHLLWHKPQLVVLGPKIEGLPDSHPTKPECLFQLSQLLSSVGNNAECKRLLVHTLKLRRKGGGEFLVAETLRSTSRANSRLGLYEEGIEQAKEALEIYRRLDGVAGQARSWQELASLLFYHKQLDAAEEATSQLINLLSDKEGDQYQLCEAHRILGRIYRSKGETGKAINHFETSIGIASSFNWHDLLFWNNYALAHLFSGENRFDEADTHIERAKSYGIDNPYKLGRAMRQQANFWYKQGRLAEAKSEALGAVKAYEKIGATKDIEDCRTLLRKIEEATN